MTFGTGWIRGFDWDPGSDRHHASEAHLRAAKDRIGTLADEGGVADVQPWGTYEPWVSNQRGDERCTMEMGRKWVYGLTGKRCSTWTGWWAGRLVDHPGQPMANVGISMNGLVEALRDTGLCPLVGLDESPLCPEYFPAEPTEEDPYAAVPPSVFRDAAQGFNLDVVQVFAFGDDAVTGLVDALAQGLPCGTVLRADDAYAHPVNGIVGPPSGGGGYHAINVDRYRFRADGRVEFRSPGSWDVTHGENGIVWLDQSRIEIAPFNGFARGVS
jgi:hypothetical protein